MIATDLQHVIVLGGGPAGAAAALGLTRMGYGVTLVSEPRRFRAVEGLSDRVFRALQGAGFEHALAAIAPPSPRRVTWNGRESAANTERLVDRQRFDQGVLQDLERHRVRVLRARAATVTRTDAGWQVELTPQPGQDTCPHTLLGAFLVEARGRAAPYPGAARVKGVETVALLSYWQGAPAPAASAVESFADGWAWMARMPDGARYLQLTLDVASASLPPKSALSEFCTGILQRLTQAPGFMADATPQGEPHARTSTPVLVGSLSGPDWIRVGDAAMAADPLSGSGIFQSLSSALQAPAVVNTLIRRPGAGALASAFHQARSESLFWRFVRVGRDFYADEQQWPQRPFWASRSAWPDQQPVHAPVTPDSLRIEHRPVVAGDLIESREVVVTPDQPLGVWHLDGVMLAPAVLAVRSAAPADYIREISSACGVGTEVAAHILRWMRQNGWVETCVGT